MQKQVAKSGKKETGNKRRRKLFSKWNHPPYPKGKQITNHNKNSSTVPNNNNNTWWKSLKQNNNTKPKKKKRNCNVKKRERTKTNVRPEEKNPRFHTKRESSHHLN